MSSLSSFHAGTNEIRASKSAFFAGGFILSTWAPMIPYIKQNLSIEPAVLGLLLLTIGLAAFLSMPLTGILTRYFGCRKVVSLSTAIMTLSVCALPWLPSLSWYFAFLFLLGASMGALDVGMNLNSVVVERVSGKRTLSGVHAFWSVGCFIGAGLFTLLAELGLTISWIAFLHSLLIGAVSCYFYRFLLPFHGDSGQKPLAFPKGIILILGIMMCLAYLAEGAIMDWSGVLLNETKGISLEKAGIGFTSYSAAMLIMRLIGDPIVQKAGEKAVILMGSLIGAVGFLSVTLAEGLPSLVLCFLMIGIGLSNVIPAFYAILAKQKDMPMDAAVTALTSMGYSGIILGPSLLGFLAQHFGIPAIYWLLFLLLAVQTLGSWKYIQNPR